jgi:hypothetical protein
MKPHMDEIFKFHPPTYEHIYLKFDGIHPISMLFFVGEFLGEYIHGKENGLFSVLRITHIYMFINEQ